MATTLTSSQFAALAARRTQAVLSGLAPSRSEIAAQGSSVVDHDTCSAHDDLADLGETLKFRPVPAGLSKMRRHASAHFAEGGRVSVSTTPAERAANRHVRRSSREALRRALEGHEVAQITRRATGRGAFGHIGGADPRTIAYNEQHEERCRRRQAARRAYEQALDAWQAQREIPRLDGYTAAWAWERENPAPVRPEIGWMDNECL